MRQIQRLLGCSDELDYVVAEVAEDVGIDDLDKIVFADAVKHLEGVEDLAVHAHREDDCWTAVIDGHDGEYYYIIE